MTCPEPGRRAIAPPRPERLLAELTPEQAQAVTHDEGPLLLLAGPGAGKTKTADTPRGLPAGDRPCTTVGDPGSHVQRPRRGRIAPAPRRAPR